MGSDWWSKYAWLDEPSVDDDLMAGCVGVVPGGDADWVRRCVGVGASPGHDATVHEAWKLSESDFGNDLIQISFIGDAVVIYKPNGWHGVDEEFASVLSQGGRYAAYYWNVNAVMRFVFAVNGHIQRDFDPLLYDADREQALPEELDLPFPSRSTESLIPGQASLALIERLTGVEITREWLLATPHPTYRIDP